jgi:hypothetical protein
MMAPMIAAAEEERRRMIWVLDLQGESAEKDGGSGNSCREQEVIIFCFTSTNNFNSEEENRS